MERKVLCPGCKHIAEGLVMVEGRLFTLRDEQLGTRVLAYECEYCGRRVHFGERDGEKVKRREGVR